MRRRVLAALAALPLCALLPTAEAAATPVPTPALGRVQDVAVQSDGKVVVAFDRYQGDRFTIVRLRADLSLDPTFGDDGVVETVVAASPFANVNDLALQPDGRILVAGHVTTSNLAVSNFAVLRLRTDGALDPAFGGGDGTVVTDFPNGRGRHPQVALAADGRIVVAGSNSVLSRTLAARLLPDGSLDTTFGTGGSTSVDLPDATESVDALALDAVGNLVIGGRYQAIPSPGPQHLLMRLSAAGQLDAGFAAGGVATWGQGTGEGGVRGVAVQPDGRIVAAGSTDHGRRETLARFSPTGQPDTTFGTGGFVTSTVAPAVNHTDRPGNDVSMLRNGRIAVGGAVGDHLRVAVYRSDGTPDPSFDPGDGAVEVPLGVPGTRDDGGYLAVTRGGAIIAAGSDVLDDVVEGTLEVVAVPSLAPASS